MSVRSFFGAVACAAVLYSSPSPAAEVRGASDAKAAAAVPLVTKARAAGRVRVIVGVRQAYRPEGSLDRTAAEQQRRDIAQAQQVLADRMRGYDVTELARFRYLPFSALEVDAAALQALVESEDVTSLEEDVAVPATLASTIPIVGADDAHTLGFTGAGQAVAILDTGVERLHSFLGGRVVSEACYSNAAPSATQVSLCPSGAASQLGLGAAEATTAACFSGAVNICDHGTHVAGIAAGNSATSTGVARSANIIAIQVFTRFNAAADCAPSAAPCVRTYTSDQVRGLERVYELRTSYNIAAANMSLGGGMFTSEAACDAANVSRKAAIDLLRSANIATVISSGNAGFKSALGAPGCISTAISVGATNDADAVAAFSNSASFLDLLAPGVNVTSSVPTGAFAAFNGTSMAAPHVTGAWALYKQLNPAATVDAIETALEATGTSVTDAGNGIAKPRLDIGAAIAAAAPQAQVLSLFPVSGATVGGTARLWAQVRNTGGIVLPADARVEYWVTGPAWVGSNIVGSTSVAGLAPGATIWTPFDWSIACTRPAGDYQYWARVVRGTTAISTWTGPQAFTVAASGAAVVSSLWPVSGATVGGTVSLWALVQNTGCDAFPADASVEYWVNGPFWTGTNVVGSVSVAGQAAGTSRWYPLSWTIAASRHAGDYQYWARVVRAGVGLSPWNGPQAFLVTGLAFDSSFNVTLAPWVAHVGAWSVSGASFAFTPGVAGQVSSISYPVDFASFDYEARIWRNGSEPSNADRLIVRGVPLPLGSSSNWRSAYLFQISRSGLYSVWKNDGETFTPIQGWTASSAVLTGATWNTLRVRAVGGAFQFFVNGTLVWSGTDTSFAAGRVGIGSYNGVASTGNGFWVDYARLTVLTPAGTLRVGASSEGEASIDLAQQALNRSARVAAGGSVDDAPRK